MNYGSTRPDCLDFNPFKAIITPRPIGWIGTLDGSGRANLAPYSFFNGLGAYPEQVYFASDGAKHSFVNARDRGEFTFSLATEDLAQAMNISSESLPYGTSEFDAAGLEKGDPVEISTPFVAESPAAFECVTIQTLQLEDRTGKLIDRYMVIGEVVRTHIRDEFIRNGRFDTLKARPIARMGYRDYTTVNEAWELVRPDD
ncbi:Flavin reductase like domain protein [Roseovarius sp. THAF8]|uniref:flavin reductase family protein n=1 Tax=Roseovarius sp. THAF8 TaxID=2587846 RepID=UPI001268EA51|nr:flavin reductase family protein [Roseovarius sp. THAF8]QFT96751.1 Flavin reductase like domain protein [Roseovarius sp. THAF8]